jgi:hypothetical protein
MRNPLPALLLAAALTATAARAESPLPEVMLGTWCGEEGNVRFDAEGRPIGKAAFYRRDCGVADGGLTVTTTGYVAAEETCRFVRLRPVGGGVRGLARCTGENGASWRWRIELRLEKGMLTLIAREVR